MVITKKRTKKRPMENIPVASTGFHFVLKWDAKSIDANRRKLRHARAIHEWSQQQLADKAGLHLGTIWKFEDTENCPQIAPRLKTWLVIIKALGGTVTVEAPNK